MVTAKSAGTADITIAATDRSGKSATCHVTVIVPVTEIRLNKSSNTLYIGETETLAATIVPSNATIQTLRWTSNNTAVADVVNGTVTAKSAGTADITVAATDGSGKSATYRITVIAHVSGVSLNKTSNTLLIGRTDQLTATVSPANAANKTVSWSSDNPAVAEVSSNGTVTAKAVGTAKITVTTADMGRTAEYNLTVIPVPVANISLKSSTNSNIVKVGAPITLTASILPSDAANQAITWTSSDPSVAEVVNGVITARSEGTAEITVTPQQTGKQMFAA